MLYIGNFDIVSMYVYGLRPLAKIITYVRTAYSDCLKFYILILTVLNGCFANPIEF